MSDDRDEEGEDGGDIEVGKDQWGKSATKRLLAPQPNRAAQQQSCTTYRVPAHIRACSPHAYDPKVVPVGIFHNKPWKEKELPAVKLKQGCARFLIDRHLRQHPDLTDTSLMQKCLQGMKSLLSRVRSSYSERVSIDDDSSAEMMFLDGCLTLYLLLKQADDDHAGDHLVMEGNLWIWSMVVYDLLLLENQIPFFVVRRLFELLRTPDDAEASLVDLALKLFSNLYPHRSANHPPIVEENIHHLLHLFYLSLLPPHGRCDSAVPPRSEPEWIPCASELRENGVKFVKKTNKAYGFLDVTFRDGTVEIPPLKLCDYSESLFRNLVAFEQCYADTGTHVTLYANFMNLLLSSRADARLLQRKGILVNQMATDKEGINFFGRICEEAHYASDANYLRSVFIEVNKCYLNRRRRWMARLVHDHCNNPWMIISLVAATVLLLLTAAQTFFTIFPYYHPPN